MKKFKDVIKLLRVKHYIKNILLFIPLVFVGGLFSYKFLYVFYGFLSFSFMASTIYIINDIIDASNDRKHDLKKDRPIASKRISVKEGIFISVITFILSCLFNYLACGIDIIIWGLLLSYFILNLCYSLYFKRVAIVDIFLLVVFYIIRIYYGAQIIDVRVSYWLYLTIMSLSFYLVLGKRKGEYISSKNTRSVLKDYNLDFLDKFMIISLSGTYVFYSLWAVNNDSKYMIFTIPIVFLIMMKYSLIIEDSKGGDPIEILYKDKILLFFGALYMILMIVLVLV